MKNKKAVTTLALIGIIVFAVILLTVLGIFAYGADLADDSISQLDVTIGNNSFQQTYQDTVQIGILQGKTTMPRIVGMGTLIGMFICLLIVAVNQKKIGPLWIILDLAIIIIAEIIAGITASRFSTFINTSPQLLNIFSTTLADPAKFILSLPITVPIIGAIIMFITQVTSKKREEEQAPF